MYFNRKRRAYMPGIKRGTLMIVLLCALAAVAAVTQIDLTTQVKGILASANGGTGIAYFTASGPTAARTYAFPDASTTVLTTNAAVTVPQGGTGLAAATAHYQLLGNGTGALTLVAPGTATNCWISNGPSADPTWQACPGALNFADAEVPTGTVDGSNAVFTLAHTPNPAASLHCDKNGQVMYAGGADFTLATATITYVTGAKPKTGDVHECSYRW